MRRMIIMLAATMLASILLTVAAEARDAAYAGPAFRHQPGAQSWSRGASRGGGPNCYFPDEWPKYPPWPPFCR